MQSDPKYPLVLPTIPGFCYGQGYPLPRVFEYYYGGVDTIVASLSDQAIVEAARSQLPLIPGQERLNNLCWFRVAAQQYEIWKLSAPDNLGRGQTELGKLNFRMLQELEDAFGNQAATSRGVAAVSGDVPKSPNLGGGSRSTQLAVPPSSGSGAVMRTGRRHDAMSSKALSVAVKASGALRRHLTAVSGKSRSETISCRHKVVHLRPRLGLLSPDDPFFWFCSQNFALHTYPADVIPRHTLSDGSPLVFCYSDVVSRSGTPEVPCASYSYSSGRRGSDASEVSDELDGDPSRARPGAPERHNVLPAKKIVPPSICLCQPTEITAHPRHRWEVQPAFVDDRGLILGDTGWFPGALGQRFIFEVKSDNSDKFIRVSEVPQAQVLFVENRKIPCHRKRRETSKDPFDTDVPRSSRSEDSSGSISSGSERSGTGGAGPRRAQGNLGAARRRPAAGARRMQAQAYGRKEVNADLMLPPLLSVRVVP